MANITVAFLPNVFVALWNPVNDASCQDEQTIIHDCNNHAMVKQSIPQTNVKVFAHYSNILLLLLCCISSAGTIAQTERGDDPAPTLNIGDVAPPLRIRQWLKGTPVKEFKKGKLYVVEFWATWCAPCKAAMPHLSALAAEYRDKVTFLSIDVMEQKSISLQKIKHFVDSMGQKMDYNVAAEDSDFMATGWLKASGEQRNSIPRVFVVNADGQLAWVGHPKNLPGVLLKITGNRWDLKEALANGNEERRLTAIDNHVNYDLTKYVKSPNWASSRDKPDSLLLAVAEIVGKEPKLKYAPFITAHTFAALLKTDMHKACEYAKEGLQTSFFGESLSRYIMGDIEFFADSLPLTPEIFQMGIEACQAEIDQATYPELVRIYKIYNRMAAWYWRINEPVKAIEAQKKAIASIKSRNHYSANDLAVLEAQLEKYRLKQDLKLVGMDSSGRN